MVLKEIKERYSARAYSEKEVSDEIIKNILTAGILAPSWLNIQPWHFIVVRDKRNKDLLAQLAHGQPHVESAGAVIICCGNKSDWEPENYSKNILSKKNITPERAEMLMKSPAFNPKLLGEEAVIYRTLEELTYAMAYMTLEAHSQGLGACIIGGIGNELTGSVPEVHELARITFGLPDNLIIMALITVGYIAEDAEIPEKTRKPFNEVVSWGTYGNNISS